MEQYNTDILKLCTEIDSLYEKHISFLKEKSVLLNSNKKLKYLSFYSAIIFGYSKEVATLQRLNWNTSIESLGRDFLEGYSFLKKLAEYFDDDAKYNEYLKYLVVNDLVQDKKIFNEMKSDSTYVDISKRDAQLDTFSPRFELYINEFFPEEASNIQSDNKQHSIFAIINRLNNKYKFYDEEKHVRIGNALKANMEWVNDNNGTSYEGAYSIYRGLCHSTHQSISSLEERLINNGIVMLNNPSKNIISTLSLIYYCLRDSLIEFEKCVDSIDAK